ncbi:hypothetical protein JSQ81_02575 [Sporosarcina sp. Marseille-Q4063]|uniref:hypothetical protein n=1 Tax=Sporosarcina sp. Marseille-Q4063 TaxID=2810514 RepID=UPI001BB01356|nr:hypothetical protein [Sporosarcina sp. Marseille-Q4063]QUW22492.1 hypothetical protein JSQ81_02575 [Sporosarcina sp. Marseille-Q4063]
MGKGHDDWGLTEDELDRLEDAVEDGIIPKSEVMANRENLKKGNLLVGELIDIWSNDDDDEY